MGGNGINEMIKKDDTNGAAKFFREGGGKNPM